MQHSNKDYSDINNLFVGNRVPNLLREIMEMGTCLRYIEAKVQNPLNSQFTFSS